MTIHKTGSFVRGWGVEVGERLERVRETGPACISCCGLNFTGTWLYFDTGCAGGPTCVVVCGGNGGTLRM